MLYLRESPVIALKSATVNSRFPDPRTLRTMSSSQLGMEDETVQALDDLLPLREDGEESLELSRVSLNWARMSSRVTLPSSPLRTIRSSAAKRLFVARP